MGISSREEMLLRIARERSCCMESEEWTWERGEKFAEHVFVNSFNNLSTNYFPSLEFTVRLYFWHVICISFGEKRIGEEDAGRLETLN